MRFGVAFVFWVLAFAVTAGALHFALAGALPWIGFSDADALWAWIDLRWPVSALFVRLIVFGAIHTFVIRALRRRIRSRSGALGRVCRRLVDSLARFVAATRARTRVAALFIATVALTVFVPFVLQPTLVPLEFGVRAWAERAANLTDGSATVAVLDSVFGTYHRAANPPVAVAPAGPTLDRWDPLVREITGGAPADVALLKAVLAVESGGRQFAVSPTGCAGLMQFCVGTARASPFVEIFGRGRVFPCARRRVSRAMEQALERGDAPAGFPCARSDARFDPRRSLRAGWRYLSDLRAELGHPDLVYIGYNSGPAVARALARRVGPRPSPTTIQAHLPAALRPYYGAASNARAAALVAHTLPRLRAGLVSFKN